MQLGSVVGVVAAPVAMLLKLRAKQSIDFKQIMKYQLYSLGFGTLLSMGMMMGKYISWENKEQCLRDRAYRIHNSYNQNRVDKITLGAFVGAGFLGFLGTGNFAQSIALTTPAVVGGLLYHLATTEKKQEKPAEVKQEANLN